MAENLTSRIRKTGISLPDIVAFVFVMGTFIGCLYVASYWAGPLNTDVQLNLTYSNLPSAVFLSISRIILAYFVCLFSSIAVGYWAAHSKIAETILVPLIDIGQSIPVLGFMPGLVLTFLAVFPHNRIGLEIAAMLMLCTGMAWNMMLSFYGSIKTIPREYLEIIRAYGYGPLGTLIRLELPYATNGLVWNSMLSVAGGWFFLMSCESFTLGSQSFRLVGLGTYMSQAAEQGNYGAIAAGIGVMILILVFADYFIWRPLLRWSESFQQMTFINKEDEEEKKSYNVVTVFTRSKRISSFMRKLTKKYLLRFIVVKKRRDRRKKSLFNQSVFLNSIAILIFIAICIWGVWASYKLLTTIPQTEWILLLKNTGRSLLRVTIVIFLSCITMVPLGLFVGSRPSLAKKLQPVIQIIAAFPAPMIFPVLTIAFLRFNIPISASSVLLMMTGAQWYLLFNVLSGTTSVPTHLVEIANLSGMSYIQTLFRVYLPASFPQILTGLITTAGGAWNTSVVAELVTFRGQEFVASGLGSYINKAASGKQIPELVAAVTMMVLVIVLLNRFFWAKLYNIAESKYRLD